VNFNRNPDGTDPDQCTAIDLYQHKQFLSLCDERFAYRLFLPEKFMNLIVPLQGAGIYYKG